MKNSTADTAAARKPSFGDLKPMGRRAFRSCLAGVVLSGMLMSMTGCSTQRMAVNAMVPILENSQEAILESPSVETFYQATPSNLFLIEGLIKSEPKNKKLRLAASMLYFSFAFAFIEGGDDDYASYLYRKGKDHGVAALLGDKEVRTGWEGTLDEFTEAIAHLDEADVPFITWAAANWAQYINLHLDSTAVLTQIPRVVHLLEHAIRLDGTYFEGLPHIMLGSLHAFRPPMLGGKPEESEAHFTDARQISGGRFLLVHYFYAKYYCYRMQDADAFDVALNMILMQPADINPPYRLLNEIAKEKALELMLEKEDLY